MNRRHDRSAAANISSKSEVFHWCIVMSPNFGKSSPAIFFHIPNRSGWANKILRSKKCKLLSDKFYSAGGKMMMLCFKAFLDTKKFVGLGLWCVENLGWRSWLKIFFTGKMVKSGGGGGFLKVTKFERWRNSRGGLIGEVTQLERWFS